VTKPTVDTSEFRKAVEDGITDTLMAEYDKGFMKGRGIVDRYEVVDLGDVVEFHNETLWCIGHTTTGHFSVICNNDYRGIVVSPKANGLTFLFTNFEDCAMMRIKFLNGIHMFNLKPMEAYHKGFTSSGITDSSTTSELVLS